MPTPPTPPYVYQYIDPNLIDNSADKHLSALQKILVDVNTDISMYTSNKASVVLELVDMSAAKDPNTISYDINLITPVSVKTKLLNVEFEGTDLQYLIQRDPMPLKMVNDVGLSDVLKVIFEDVSIMKLLLDAKNYMAPIPPAGP
jgi:hypothetical protein